MIAVIVAPTGTPLVLRPGDVLGFSNPCWGDAAINLGTAGWPCQWPDGWRGLSHVGICGGVPRRLNISLSLWESHTDHSESCLVCGKRKPGVHAHPIRLRLAETLEAGGSVWHYPLAKPLSNEAVSYLNSYILVRDGTPYDWKGAADARRTWVSWARWKMCGGSDAAKLYCWELAARALTYCLDGTAASAVRKLIDYSPNTGTRALVRLGILRPPTRITQDTKLEIAG